MQSDNYLIPLLTLKAERSSAYQLVQLIEVLLRFVVIFFCGLSPHSDTTFDIFCAALALDHHAAKFAHGIKVALVRRILEPAPRRSQVLGHGIAVVVADTEVVLSEIIARVQKRVRNALAMRTPLIHKWFHTLPQ